MGNLLLVLSDSGMSLEEAEDILDRTVKRMMTSMDRQRWNEKQDRAFQIGGQSPTRIKIRAWRVRGWQGQENIT